MTPKVPIGPTTIAGYTVTLTSFVLAIFAYLQGDHSQQTLGVLTAGAAAIVAFAITQIGRYAQAKVLAHYHELAPPVPPTAIVQNFPGRLGDQPVTAGLTDDIEPEPTDTLGAEARHLTLVESPPPDEGDIGTNEVDR